jgi:endoglucanase
VLGVIGKGGKKRVMIEAHLDEIGLMVKNIDEAGFVKFVPVGGIDPAILPATGVWIHGKKTIFGVIGAKPPHLQTEEDTKNKYTWDDLYIDAGYSYAEISEIVTIGDVISFPFKPKTLLNGCVSVKSVDNRAGVLIVLEVLKRLKNRNIGAEIVGLCAVMEEVGCRGATVGAYSAEPDFAVVVDVTHGRSPYVDEQDGFLLESGAAIGVGPNLHRGLTKRLMACADARNIPYTVEVCPGDSGTDAGPIQISRQGVPCVLASIPLRYMHTGVETVSVGDIEKTIDLICAFVESEAGTC